MRIASNLRVIRDLSGLTQTELSEMCGVSQGRISQYEHGEGLSTVYRYCRIAKALGCRLDDLFYVSE